MKVVVAVIFDNEQRVLITRRPSHVPHGGLWEFPGGKLEVGESPEEALIREIKEEVDIDIVEYSFVGEIGHSYDTKCVELLIFSVGSFLGTASCKESQTGLAWVHADKLSNYQFPAANRKIIELVKKSD